MYHVANNYVAARAAAYVMFMYVCIVYMLYLVCMYSIYAMLAPGAGALETENKYYSTCCGNHCVRRGGLKGGL